MTMRKYRRGRQLHWTQDVVLCLTHSLMLHWRGKTYHPAFIMSWPLRSVANEIQAGRLYTAVKRKEWLKKHGAAVASDAKGGER